jgi:hypothetical protein
MSTTVLECLQNGIQNMTSGLVELGFEQVVNGVAALGNGMMPNDIIQANLDAPIRTKPEDPLDWPIEGENKD